MYLQASIGPQPFWDYRRITGGQTAGFRISLSKRPFTRDGNALKLALVRQEKPDLVIFVHGMRRTNVEIQTASARG